MKFSKVFLLTAGVFAVGRESITHSEDNIQIKKEEEEKTEEPSEKPSEEPSKKQEENQEQEKA